MHADNHHIDVYAAMLYRCSYPLCLCGKVLQCEQLMINLLVNKLVGTMYATNCIYPLNSWFSTAVVVNKSEIM